MAQCFILEVDGAGSGHGTAILGDDRQVGGAVIVWDKVVGLVVAVGVGGVVRDLTANTVGKVVRGHVLDELRRHRNRAEHMSVTGPAWM